MRLWRTTCPDQAGMTAQENGAQTVGRRCGSGKCSRPAGNIFSGASLTKFLARGADAPGPDPASIRAWMSVANSIWPLAVCKDRRHRCWCGCVQYRGRRATDRTGVIRGSVRGSKCGGSRPVQPPAGKARRGKGVLVPAARLRSAVVRPWRSGLRPAISSN